MLREYNWKRDNVCEAATEFEEVTKLKDPTYFKLKISELGYSIGALDYSYSWFYTLGYINKYVF